MFDRPASSGVAEKLGECRADQAFFTITMARFSAATFVEAP
jgi:hypothetical protein